MGDIQRYREIKGNKKLLEALKFTPAFKRFREANFEKIQAELEAKRTRETELPPGKIDFNLESIIMKTFLHSPEGLPEAEKIKHIIQRGRRGLPREVLKKGRIKRLDSDLVGGSEHIAKLVEEISYIVNKIKKHDFSVLIEGPSGTGKELIAKAISNHSGRKNFVAINCAALPGNLFESELFGYKRGAFTGAVKDKPGLIESAEGGVLFLDEIGDLSPEHQGKILRLLHEKTYIPVGDIKEHHIGDIRIIAATNKDLGKEIKDGRFREDLYHRLNHRTIQTIPLKERQVDIICLLHYFLGKRKLEIDPRAKALLYSYDFPGNVRELESLLFSADDYPYIKEALAKRVSSRIGKDFNQMLQ